MKIITHISLRYILYAFVVMLVSIPVFYYALQKIMFNNLDEGLMMQEEWIEKKLPYTDAQNFTSFNNSIIIKEVPNSPSYKKIFSKDILIPEDSEIVTHRILEAQVTANGKTYFIHIQKSLVENEDLIQSIVILLICLLAALLLGLFFINRYVSKKIWQPFYTTLSQLRNYKVNLNEPLKLAPTKVDEFAALNSSVTTLTQNASTLFNAQKEFTENASHELQTPLAIMQGKLELLMQTDPLTDEQAHLITEIEDAGQRMARLNRTLLLLSKIENRQYQLQDNIKLDESVLEILNIFEEQAVHKNITVIKELNSGYSFTANKTLFDIMIGNLINNAIRHSEVGSKITVRTSGNEFTIANPADHGPLNTEKLFRRFQKQNADEKSTGLGLELSHKIAVLFNASLQYDFRDNEHFFSIKL